MDMVKIDDQPKLVLKDEIKSDNTSTVILYILIPSILLIVVFMSMRFMRTKERSLFIYHDLDIICITGSKHKKVVGGILTLFFIYYIAIIWMGYFYHYLARNEHRELSETFKSNIQSEIPSSFEIEIKAYMSKVKESDTPFLMYRSSHGVDTNYIDLCKKKKYSIQGSPHLKLASEQYSSCKRERLNDFTDVYTLKSVYKNIPKDKDYTKIINIELHSNYTQVVHFFHWKLKSVWEYDNSEKPLAYSEAEGIMTPQDIENQNLNITKAFKGPDPTILFFDLVQTHYMNEIEGVSRDGYRVSYTDYIRGSTVNKRTLINQYQYSGENLEGFQVQFRLKDNKMLYQVRIQKIRSIFGVLTFMFAFLAAFLFVVRIAKYHLSKLEYFKQLDERVSRATEVSRAVGYSIPYSSISL